MIWFKENGTEGSRTKADAMKRTMMASLCAGTLLLAAGSAARAETIVVLH